MKVHIFKTGLITMSLILSGSFAFASGADKPHWGYEGHEGPAHWGDLATEYATCKTGKSQSPINITGTKSARLADIKFSYQPSVLHVVNNGHSI
jgi:carbonic anhydrase